VNSGADLRHTMCEHHSFVKPATFFSMVAIVWFFFPPWLTRRISTSINPCFLLKPTLVQPKVMAIPAGCGAIGERPDVTSRALLSGLVALWRAMSRPAVGCRDRSCSTRRHRSDVLAISRETRRPAGLYMTNHTFSVCVENGNPTQFRSNCKLYLNIANQKDHGSKDYWLDGPFTLNPIEKRFRSIVSYLEPASVSQHTSDFIQLHIPIGQGYGVGYGWPWRLPLGAYAFTLWASCLEEGRTELACKIWVDDGHKLHFEKACDVLGRLAKMPPQPRPASKTKGRT
jgi:hypothetical protein